MERREGSGFAILNRQRFDAIAELSVCPALRGRRTYWSGLNRWRSGQR